MRGQSEATCFNNLIKSNIRWLTSKQGLETISELIKHAKPNQQASNFPDFLCELGIIEHFTVSSATENKKGSKQKQAETKFRKIADKKGKEFFEKGIPYIPGYIEVQSVSLTSASADKITVKSEKGRPLFESATREVTDYSYENYIKSFKKNFEHHIKSLKKHLQCNKPKTTCFLFEINGGTFKIFENGVYKKQLYSLDWDSVLLNYIKQYGDVLDYIILQRGEESDILQVNLIDKVLEGLPENITFEAGRCISTQLHVKLCL